MFFPIQCFFWGYLPRWDNLKPIQLMWQDIHVSHRRVPPTMEIDQQFPAGFIGLADYFPIDYVQYSSQPNSIKAYQNIQKHFFLATNEWCASDFFMELSPFCAAQFLKLIPLLFNPHWENWIGLVWRNCHRIPMHLMVNKDGFMQLVFQNDYAFEREHIRSSSYLPAFRYLWSPASWW